MAKKITDFTALVTVADTDVFVVDDVSANETKKVTGANLKSYILGSGVDIGGTGSGDIITTDASQTLTNKTLTTPVVNGDQLDADGTELNMNIYAPPVIKRAVFTYNGGTTAYTIKLKTGAYRVKDKIAFVNSEITTAAIGTPSANTWYGLFIDYSAVTSETEITNAALRWVDIDTNPEAWNDTYGGWFDSDDAGNDLMIMAVKTNGTPDNILYFVHAGDLITQTLGNSGYTAMTSAWQDFNIEGPASARKFNIRIQSTFTGGAGNLGDVWWRVKGDSGNGQQVSQLQYDSMQGSLWHPFVVAVNSDQIIQMEYRTYSTASADLYTDGWFLPEGM